MGVVEKAQILGIGTVWTLLGLAAQAGAAPLTTPAAAACLIHTKSSLCSASLIAPDLILTAAHCFHPGQEQTPSEIRIQCAPRQSSSGALTGAFLENFVARSLRIDPAYANNADHDLALIATDHPSRQLEPLKLPIRLAQARSELFEQAPLGAGDLQPKRDTSCQFSGFGPGSGNRAEFKTIEMSPQRGVTLMLHDAALYIQSSDHVAVRNKKGDSGGPLYCRAGKPGSSWIQVGVMSHCYAKREGENECRGDSGFASIFSEAFLEFHSGTRLRWKLP